ncbi:MULTISPECIES: DUF6327 family protein [Mangrovimonas]|uniref:DUF6327 family protein n=1 Tax=Mangrovimonas TaxID=1211036 RepID=UPI0006B5296A|nr:MULTISPECIES: DUF6327 family protein [Mangrovimonas]OMP32803.1 hypothetical protein BKM32_00380 [Mangrovimonas sp. DI 80]
MKKYSSFAEIEHDLKRLDLERKIALEELKGVKGGLKEDLRPSNWMQLVLNSVGKYGAYLLFKKLF